jgi:hypothetical protein
VDVALAYLVLCLAQAGTVELPGRPPRLPEPLHGRGWSLLPPLAVAAGALALAVLPAAAARATDLAAVATPLCALAAPLLARGARRRVLLVAVALALPAAFLPAGWLAGDAGRVTLIALACSTLATLFAAVTPPRALEAAIVVVAAADVVLVASGPMSRAARHLHAAHSPLGLPRLQEAVLGSVTFGWGDLFLAALLGALLAGQPRRHVAALAVATFGAVYGLLLLRVAILPATVPVAVGLAAAAIAGRRRQPSFSM